MSVIPMKSMKIDFRNVPKNDRKVVRSVMDTKIITQDAASRLKLPPFQRPLKVNKKVKEIAELMKENGVIEGVLTFGALNGDEYLVDGQHRIHAFILSELDEVYADVRICQFDTMGEMAEEFKKLNSPIARMSPDDILRAEEHKHECLKIIRKECPFVGYGYLHLNGSSPVLSMSVLMRAWIATRGEVPAMRSGGGLGRQVLVETISDEELKSMIGFLKVAFSAWGRDKENSRLWARLNLILCLWLWRNVVMKNYSVKATRFTVDQFRKGLMALSADANYIEWLAGRAHERDRAPAYGRIRGIFNKRLQDEIGHKIQMPAPDWTTKS